MAIESKECFSSLTIDGQLYEIYQAAQTGGGGTPSGPAGGDLSGTYPNPTVDGLQGRPVSNATPVNGQVLQFDGTNWVPGAIPSGGSGGGGILYYLNFNTAADTPLTNIPQTPNATKELGIVGETTQTSYLSPILSTASYDFLASFATDLNVPSATAIPAGIWDFNLFIQSTTTNSANQIYFKVEIRKYDGTNAPVLLATSSDTYIYDPAEINQYVASVVMPQTTILSTDRIVVYLYGRAHQNNNRLTFYFGGSYPAHTHTTMPSVTGTGVVKVVNGVFQSPATTIVNADVSATAAIAVSKLSQATNRILGRTTAGTGAVEEITIGTGLSLSAGTLTSTVSGTVTSVTATSPITSSGGAAPVISTSMATNRILGRTTTGTGVAEELSVAGNLVLSAGSLTARAAVTQIFTSSGTWTKPTGAVNVNVQLLGGGGGGGSGRRDATALTAKSGGGGAGGGSYLNVTISASVLGGSESVTIGAGGTGGAGITAAATNGNNGVAGGSTTFNSLISLGGAAGGGGSTTAGAAGAGVLQANPGGAAGASGAIGTAGSPANTVGVTQPGGPGGGGAGGVNATTVAAAGAVGGRSNILNLAGGTAGGVATAGANGNDNTNAVNGLFAVGSGGGGGGGGVAVSGGNGGNGGFPSGGGGGGGATETGTTSGTGGTGGAGLAIITTYF